ncbi:MAG: hypothetical protein WC774_02550 [Candidatus Gracilibacteria bacterium]
MKNTFNNTTIVMVGGSTNPVLALVDKGKFDALLAGVCISCNNPFRVCNCKESEI